jgi:hypothetical protein
VSPRKWPWVVFAVVCLTNGLLLWYFHDRYWYPTDDGFHAHIAERLLAGEVLNRDIQDIHPGLLHFVDAAAFQIFGIDLVSLRYPMIAAVFVQSVCVFLLLRRRDALLAAIASIAGTALGVVHFMSPTANWYCLALAVVLAWWLTAVRPDHPARLVGAGALLAAMTLFRHLSGVWAAMGIISFVLLERSTDATGRGVLLARLQVSIMLAALVAYLVLSPETQPGGLILMGIWPVLLLGWMLGRLRSRNRDVASAIGQLLAGVVIVTTPLLVYHLVHGSVGILFRDLVEVAAGELNLPFYGQGWFNVLSLAGLLQATSSLDPVKILNGLYWAVMPAASALNGILVIRHLRRGTQPGTLALPILAVFYALVSLNFEGGLYLHYAVPLTIISLLWLAAGGSGRQRLLSATAVAVLCLVSVAFHAGQTRERTPRQVLQGDRITEFSSLVDCRMERCSLQVSRADAATYGRLVGVIQAQTTASESILALPNDAELYFLARRRNAVRFYNAALGMVDARDVEGVLDVFRSDPPRLVIFRPTDKYNTPHVAEIMAVVRGAYTHVETIEGAEVYRR